MTYPTKCKCLLSQQFVHWITFFFATFSYTPVVWDICAKLYIKVNLKNWENKIIVAKEKYILWLKQNKDWGVSNKKCYI